MRIIAQGLSFLSSHLIAVNTQQTQVITFFFLTCSNGKLKVNEVVKTACVLCTICKELWEPTSVGNPSWCMLMFKSSCRHWTLSILVSRYCGAAVTSRYIGLYLKTNRDSFLNVTLWTPSLVSLECFKWLLGLFLSVRKDTTCISLPDRSFLWKR